MTPTQNRWPRRASRLEHPGPDAGRGGVMVTPALLLPLLALSLAPLWLFDRFALPRLPGLANWFGVTKTPVSR